MIAENIVGSVTTRNIVLNVGLVLKGSERVMIARYKKCKEPCQNAAQASTGSIIGQATLRHAVRRCYIGKDAIWDKLNIRETSNLIRDKIQHKYTIHYITRSNTSQDQIWDKIQ